MDEHKSFLEAVAFKIASLPTDRVQRVAIDGVDGAGKTTLANQIAPLVEGLGRTVIRASVDGFHNQKHIRYKAGKGPASFFHDSYNYAELKKVLLDPLSPGGNSNYVSAIFDVEHDRPVNRIVEIAIRSDILIFDGIFLHRPELRGYWDFSLFLDVRFEQSIPRGAQRGSGSPDVYAASNTRYVEGQKMYLEQCEPAKIATMHIDYNDLQRPRVLRTCKASAL